MHAPRRVPHRHGHPLSHAALLQCTRRAACTACNNCDVSTPEKLIDHSLNCSIAGFTPSHRHSLVKAELAKILRRYNFAVAVEPSLYIHNYTDGIAHKPDITVFSPIPVATDIVVSQQDRVPGVAARAAAKKKINLHNNAVRKAGHVFFPFALEAHGYEHSSVQAFIKCVMQFRPRFEEQELMRDVRTGVSVTLARARMHSVLAMFGIGAFQRKDETERDLNQGRAAHSLDEDLEEN